MKQLSCEQMGGPCKAMISGNTPEEMIDNGMKHVVSAHPAMKADMDKMPKSEMDKWQKDFMKKWKSTPDMK